MLVLVLLSAESEEALVARVRELANALQAGAATTGVVRAAVQRNAPTDRWRVAVRSDVSSLSDALLAVLDAPRCAAAHSAASADLRQTAVRATPLDVPLPARTAIAFPGMGTEQWWQLDPALLRALDAAPLPATAPSPGDVKAYQPMLFQVHCALQGFLESAGVHFDCVASFSAGEPSGARASRCVAPADGTKLSQAMADGNTLAMGKGTMLICIGADTDVVQKVAEAHGVNVGAFIGKNLNALSGTVDGLRKAEADLSKHFAAQIEAGTVKLIDRSETLKIPFHSHIFDALESDLHGVFDPTIDALAPLDKAQLLPWHSSVRGALVSADDVRSFGFWFALLRDPSLSLRVMQSLFDADTRVFAEMNCMTLYSRTFAELAGESAQLSDNQFAALPVFEFPASRDTSGSDVQPLTAFEQAEQLLQTVQVLFLVGSAVDADKTLDVCQKLSFLHA